MINTSKVVERMDFIFQGSGILVGTQILKILLEAMGTKEEQEDLEYQKWLLN